MKVILKPKVPEKNPTNVYRIEVEFMHGDADSYTQEIGSYDTEEEFLKAYAIFKSWLDFREAYHNTACDLCRYDKKELQNNVDQYTVKSDDWALQQAADYQRAIDFLGENDYLSSMFEKAGIETPGDVTCDHQFPAALTSIESMTYFDRDGVEFIASVE